MITISRSGADYYILATKSLLLEANYLYHSYIV